MKLNSALLIVALALTPTLRANFIGIYDYMNALGGSYAAQTGNEKWTFHNGDQNGTLMGLYAGVGYGNVGAYAQFSSPGIAGAQSIGSAGANEAAGIFTHTASSGLVSAVFHADSAFVANSFVFTHELIGNGNQGNGLDLSLRTVIGGVASDHGILSITQVTSAQTTFAFAPGGLHFNPGDEVVVMFGNRGSYLYDHGWWDIAVQESSNPVPEQASTSALFLMGLVGLASLHRRVGGRWKQRSEG